MTAPRSRRVAGWLLERCLSGPERDAVIGDILERHARSRSARWLWIDTLTAIVLTTTREIQAHFILLPLAAFFLGYGAAALVGAAKMLPGPAVLDQLLAGAVAGWVVGRLGRLPALVTFEGIVLLSTLPRTHQPVFDFLDHFGGAWLIATYALRALPPSIVVAQVCIAAGGFWAVSRTPSSPIPARPSA